MDADNRPEPPADLTDDLLGEWKRICREIEAAGRVLQAADSSLLATYVRTWDVSQDCYKHVREKGAVITWPNGTSSASPQYKTFRETVQLLRGLLADLGATPASRGFDRNASEPGELDFD